MIHPGLSNVNSGVSRVSQRYSVFDTPKAQGKYSTVPGHDSKKKMLGTRYCTTVSGSTSTVTICASQLRARRGRGTWPSHAAYARQVPVPT